MLLLAPYVTESAISLAPIIRARGHIGQYIFLIIIARFASHNQIMMVGKNLFEPSINNRINAMKHGVSGVRPIAGIE